MSEVHECLPVRIPRACAPGLVTQTPFTPLLAHLLRDIRSDMVSLEGLSVGNEQLRDLINQAARKQGIELLSTERDQILVQLEREQRPFGILQGLVESASISDIIVKGYSSISVQQDRRMLSTDLMFPDQSSYEAFVERLLQRAGASYSVKRPIVDGMLGTSVRIHAIHKSLCESGPYLTLRINRFTSINTLALAERGLAPLPILDYLSAIAALGNTILIAGEVGSGKTTLLRAVASSISTHESLVVIEDTPEIRLDHPHVRYVTTREMNSEGAGRIAPQECIRAGMRMAMHRIIFGEMRDSEAAEAFIDVCSSGHRGLSTIHAKSGSDALARLELFLGRSQRGVARNFLQEQIAQAVQVVVCVGLCPTTGVRRIFEVREIGPATEGVIRQREIFRYKEHAGAAEWKVMHRVSAYREQLEHESVRIVLSELPPILRLSSSKLQKLH